MVDKKQKHIATNIAEHLKKLPKLPLIIAGASCVVLCAVILILWPRQVVFSYQQRGCIAVPTVLPGLIKSDSRDFKLLPDRLIKFGDIPVAAGGVCIQPITAPQPGSYRVGLLFFGVPFFAKQITVDVGSSPSLSTISVDKPIPVSKNLQIPLKSPDNIFAYRVMFNDQTVACQNENVQISCKVQDLALRQGTSYTFRLDRYFAGKKVATVINRNITTLSAATVQAMSIQRNQMVFDKPKIAEIQLDKPIAHAQAALSRLDGNKDAVPVEVTVKDKSVVIKWSNDLARQADYQLTLTKAEAVDGSSLVEPFALPFKTSGGPKVTAVSVGSSRVPLGAKVTITFDQPLLENQDIAKIVTASGGATIVGYSGAQIFVSFAAVPKCGDVVLKINDLLQSNYGVAGGTGWQYATRTICHTIGSIGVSVRGRAISAYYFGDGPNTIIYTGAIHGNEPSTRALMLRWIDDLEANARSIPADKTVIVVPSINPDGFAAGTRTNANNVDLNRNFDTSDWKKDITTVTNAPFPGGGGPSPQSEPETRAIAGLVSRTRPRLVLSYHSIGGIVAANGAGISGSQAGTYASLSGYGNATGATGSVFEYSVSGTAEDYYAEKLGVASILVELGSHTYHQFDRNQKAMWAIIR